MCVYICIYLYMLYICFYICILLSLKPRDSWQEGKIGGVGPGSNSFLTRSETKTEF